MHDSREAIKKRIGWKIWIDLEVLQIVQSLVFHPVIRTLGDIAERPGGYDWPQLSNEKIPRFFDSLNQQLRSLVVVYRIMGLSGVPSICPIKWFILALHHLAILIHHARHSYCVVAGPCNCANYKGQERSASFCFISIIQSTNHNRELQTYICQSQSGS